MPRRFRLVSVKRINNCWPSYATKGLHLASWPNRPHTVKNQNYYNRTIVIDGKRKSSRIHVLCDDAVLFRPRSENLSPVCTGTAFPFLFRFLRNETVLFSVQRWTIYICIVEVISNQSKVRNCSCKYAAAKFSPKFGISQCSISIVACAKWEITIETRVSRYHIRQENYRLDFLSDSDSEKEIYSRGT